VYQSLESEKFNEILPFFTKLNNWKTFTNGIVIFRTFIHNFVTYLVIVEVKSDIFVSGTIF
jgi:hypothetical protein